jgi:hypothetical protein
MAFIVMGGNFEMPSGAARTCTKDIVDHLPPS